MCEMYKLKSLCALKIFGTLNTLSVYIKTKHCGNERPQIYVHFQKIVWVKSKGEFAAYRSS